MALKDDEFFNTARDDASSRTLLTRMKEQTESPRLSLTAALIDALHEAATSILVERMQGMSAIDAFGSISEACMSVMSSLVSSQISCMFQIPLEQRMAMWDNYNQLVLHNFERSHDLSRASVLSRMKEIEAAR